jgi:thiol-disulfide isomerase/thioredoxin
MRTRTCLLFLLAVTAACGMLRAEPAAAGEGLAVGQPAPAFMLKTLAGEDFYTKDYVGETRGKRFRQERNVLVLSFFASWCKPCKQEIPFLHELAVKYAADGVKFFLVNKGEERSVAEGCVLENVYTLPVLLDPYEVACKKYKLKELPTLVVIDRAGNVADYHSGFVPGDQDSLKAKLDKLLGKVKPVPVIKVDSTAIRAKAKADSTAAAKSKKKKGAKGKAPAAAKTPAAAGAKK